jgi:hypothetical protein
MLVLLKEEDVLHYGVIRRSGRYPWGSGKDENTHNKHLLDYVSEMRSQGLTEKEAADGLGMTINELRAEKSNATNQQKQSNIAMAQRLKDKGYSNVAIGERMGGVPESTVRSWLAPGAKDKADILTATTDMLRREVDEKGLIDVGSGVERHIEIAPGHVGVSATRLATACEKLKAEGYELHNLNVPQASNVNLTKTKVLCPPGTTQRDVFMNQDKIMQIGSFSETGGRNFTKTQPPLSIDPKRLSVVYKEDGGGQADGVVYVRTGVKDISLGGNQYAQVRVKVGNDHYIKGMAVHRDDLPDGVDLLYHTNKSKHDVSNKLDVLKPIDHDHPELPFGTIVRQIGDDLGTPKAKVTSAMNIVNEQGNWEKWSRNLSSQMLSKQSPALAKSQLDMTYEKRMLQHADIMKLTNPVVRKRLLEDFAASTDAAAVHLKAASLPQQAVHVLLPLSNIKRTEVFAPTYENGERVVLVRHPHGGPFEIPELIVNNRNAEGRKLIGRNSTDAIGIHHSVAERLSGADFDGDTVLVINNRHGRVQTKPALEDLKGFDPRSAYPKYEGMKPMTSNQTQTEMGKISNLITDMSIRQAPPNEIARAVKHSMVVIDAEKHELNYKLSYNDNGIKELKKKYQSGGASTLISRSRREVKVPERKARLAGKGGRIDPQTGELRWEPTNRKFKGKLVETKTTELAEAKDAFSLVSGTTGTPIERLYAAHSNKLKGLANKARLDSLNTPTPKQSPSAKKVYEKERKSLDAQLSLAISNRPKERRANIIANTQMKAYRDYNPNLDKATIKKLKFQTLTEARLRTGAHKDKIVISDKEWEAIQAGAISASKLNDILNNANMDVVRDHATPKTTVLMTSAKSARASSMLASGYTRAEVAQHLGVSLSTLDKSMNVEGG